jgi:hypothetical protein
VKEGIKRREGRQEDVRGGGGRGRETKGGGRERDGWRDGGKLRVRNEGSFALFFSRLPFRVLASSSNMSPTPHES